MNIFKDKKPVSERDFRNGDKVVAIRDIDWIKEGTRGVVIPDNTFGEYILVKWEDARNRGHTIDRACWNVHMRHIRKLNTVNRIVI